MYHLAEPPCFKETDTLVVGLYIRDLLTSPAGPTPQIEYIELNMQDLINEKAMELVQGKP